MKRIVTLQDISCIGKCSLGVALPIISAFGIECGIIPTAILSNHTAFESFSFLDLTDNINTIWEQWEKQDILFDGMYTGYLGSIKQIDIVSNLVDKLKSKNENAPVIVDPAMADNGKLYSGFTKEYCEKMRELCKKADIVLPNLTEASLLTESEYKECDYSEEYIKNMLVKLCEIGSRKSAITGVGFEKGKMGVMSYNAETKKFHSIFYDEIEKRFHGTGDIFASTFTGAYIKGFSFEKALELADWFVVEAIKKTVGDENSVWYGVNFEEALKLL